MNTSSAAKVKATMVPSTFPDPVKREPSWQTISEMTQAKPHWQAITKVHFAPFISRLMAPMAAKQGAQSRLKTRKEYAEKGRENRPHIDPDLPAVFSDLVEAAEQDTERTGRVFLGDQAGDGRSRAFPRRPSRAGRKSMQCRCR